MLLRRAFLCSTNAAERFIYRRELDLDIVIDMLGLAARRTFGLTKASVPKRFSGAGYIMRPPKGWLDVVDTDFDHKEGPPRMSPEHRERIYLNQMKLYSREAIDLGADPDPQVRKVRLCFSSLLYIVVN